MNNKINKESFIFKKDVFLKSHEDTLNRRLSTVLRNCSFNSHKLLNISAKFEIAETKSGLYEELISNNQKIEKVFCLINDEKNNNINLSLSLDKELHYNLLDLLLGGRSNIGELDVKERDVTKIEQKIIKNFCNNFFHIFNENIEHKFRFKTRSISSCNNDYLIIPKDQICYQINVLISSGNKVLGNMIIVIPLEILSSLFCDNAKKENNHKESLKNYFAMIISEMTLKLEIKHSEKSTKIGQLNHLKVGDTIVLDKFSEDLWCIYANQKKVSEGKIGQLNNRIAVEMTSDINSKHY